MQTQLKISIGNNILLTDVAPEVTSWFIEHLTFNNPKYQDALDNGRYTANIEKFITMYTLLPNGIVVPRGYLQLIEQSIISRGNKIDIHDSRILLEPIDVQSNISLRPYQAKAKLNLLKHPNGILTAPAGSGKTVMGLELFAALRQRMLWVTHTKRLVEQVRARILGGDGEHPLLSNIEKDDIGMIGSGKWKIGNKITIGLVQTLVRRHLELNEIGREFGLVIIDECLIEGSKIVLLDGSVKDIKDIQDGEVTTFGKVSNKFVRYTNKLIKLRSGFGTLSGTFTHKLPYIPHSALISKRKDKNHYRPVQETDVKMESMCNINVDDFLLVQESIQHTHRHTIGTERARLLALIACDGHIEKHLRYIQIGIVKDKEWFLNEIRNNTTFANKSDIRLSNCKRGDLIIREYSKEIIEYLNKYIPAGNKSRIIVVPSIMFNTSTDDIKNYLQVVFDTEGSVTDQITVTMSSHEFIYEIQHLLKKFGIVGRIIPIKRKSMLRIALSGYDAFLFWKKIGFSIKRKQDHLLNMMKETNKFRRLVKYNNILYRCMPVIEKGIIKKHTKVYDFTTDEHLFIANGVLSSNCHHVPATTFLKVLQHFYAYYMYGLTATPYRRDKLEAMMFASVGLPNAAVTRQEVKKAEGIMTPKVIVRTIMSSPEEDNDYHRIMNEVVIPNEHRSNLIAEDVVREAKKGNFCIVINTRKVYCEILTEKISKYWSKTGIANGDYSDKHNESQVEKLENGEITVLVTTFDLLGEGFDVKKLNRGFIALPFRERTRVEQAVGRIQRTCDGKKDALLYDYVDENVGILNNQARSRQFVYKALGMRITH